MPEEKNRYELLMENPVSAAGTYAGVIKPETNSNVVLTIAVPSIAERLTTTLPRVINNLFEQAKGKPVEVTCLLDNKKMTLSEKRNFIITTARGKFIGFVDDDDTVEDDYIEKILGAITLKPDSLCVVFDALVHGYAVDGTWSTPEKPPVDKICKYGIEFAEWTAPDTYYRKPNHVMVYNTKFARSLPAYINVRSEDYFWSMNAWKRITPDKQVRIDKVLYHYNFDPKTTQQGACDWVMSNR